jgi:hypothetical protein
MTDEQRQILDMAREIAGSPREQVRPVSGEELLRRRAAATEVEAREGLSQAELERVTKWMRTEPQPEPVRKQPQHEGIKIDAGGKSGLNMMAARFRPGAISVSSSSHLLASAAS